MNSECGTLSPAFNIYFDIYFGISYHEKTCHMFPLSTENVANTKHHEKYFVQPVRTERLKNSAIHFMQRLLNKYVLQFVPINLKSVQ